ncbi:MAG: hypothetical protein WC365_01040 [Candidatus Babeliales bacterium]|jgi:hypothetical protein
MITWKQVKYLIRLYSLLATALFAALMFVIWYMAYFGGYDAVIVTINDLGEKMLEFYSWFIIIPTMAYGFYLNFVEVFCGKRN